jgi:hypothetical protein
MSVPSSPSPRKTGVGMVQNYTSLNSPESGARSSRMAIKDELVGKLVFDDPRVFQRLALDRVSPDFVDKCVQALQTDQKLLDAKRELQKITSTAAGKSPEELEEEEDVEDTVGKRTVKKKVEEKKMYKPLVCFRSSQLRELLTMIRHRRACFNAWKTCRIPLVLPPNIRSSVRTRQF